MTEDGYWRVLMRATTIACALATGACGHLYERMEPDAREKVTQYIESLDVNQDDPRLSSLRTYGSTMVQMLETNVTDGAAMRETAVALDRRQACLTQSWGWKAEEHRNALTNMLLETEEAQAHYVAYLKEATYVAPTRGDPCNY